MEKINTKSKLFDKYPHYCIDLIQTLITLPLIKLPKDNIKTSYKTMVNEFYKIEKEISSTIYILYIFKKIIDCARYLKICIIILLHVKNQSLSLKEKFIILSLLSLTFVILKIYIMKNFYVLYIVSQTLLKEFYTMSLKIKI